MAITSMMATVGQLSVRTKYSKLTAVKIYDVGWTNSIIGTPMVT